MNNHNFRLFTTKNVYSDGFVSIVIKNIKCNLSNVNNKKEGRDSVEK
jgi:hypothetical protein